MTGKYMILKIIEQAGLKIISQTKDAIKFKIADNKTITVQFDEYNNVVNILS